LPCQFFAGRPKLPDAPLGPVVVEAPFQQWGLDFEGKLHENSSNGFSWILMAMDCFTWWVEAIATKEATAGVIVRFLEDNIITRVGTPLKIVIDNALAFRSMESTTFCAKYKV
jgi:hypothetical protein